MSCGQIPDNEASQPRLPVPGYGPSYRTTAYSTRTCRQLQGRRGAFSAAMTPWAWTVLRAMALDGATRGSGHAITRQRREHGGIRRRCASMAQGGTPWSGVFLRAFPSRFLADGALTTKYLALRLGRNGHRGGECNGIDSHTTITKSVAGEIDDLWPDCTFYDEPKRGIPRAGCASNLD